MEASSADNTTQKNVTLNLNNRGAMTEILKSVFNSEDGIIDKQELVYSSTLKLDFTRGEESSHCWHRDALQELDASAFIGFEHLKKVIIHGAALHTINADTFMHMRQLEELMITNCDLSELDSGVFKHLSALQKLTLSANKIKHLDDRIFASLGALTHLDLSHNHLAEIKDGAFSDLRALETLDVSHNPLHCALSQQKLEGLDKLHQLKMINCCIGSICDNSFQHLGQLTILDLSHNQIVGELRGKQLSGLGAIERLDLSHNGIDGIREKALAGLSNLTCLNLSSNLIEHIGHAGLSGMMALQSLDLSHNKLIGDVAIAESAFREFERLKQVDLSRNEGKSYDVVRLGVDASVQVTYDDHPRDIPFYQLQIERTLNEQDTYIPWGHLSLVRWSLNLVGRNKVHLIGYLKVLPVFLVLALIATAGLSEEYFLYALLIPFVYNLISCLSFLATYRFRLRRFYDFHSLSTRQDHISDFLHGAVIDALKKHDMTSPPEVMVMANSSHKKPFCDIVGLSKNNYLLYVSEALFSELNRTEIEALVEMKMREAESAALPINTIFRAAWLPFPLWQEFQS